MTSFLGYLSAQRELGPPIGRACREYYFLMIFREKIFFSTRGLIFFGVGVVRNNFRWSKYWIFTWNRSFSLHDVGLKIVEIYSKSLEINILFVLSANRHRKTFSSMFAVMKLSDLKSHHFLENWLEGLPLSGIPVMFHSPRVQPAGRRCWLVPRSPPADMRRHCTPYEVALPTPNQAVPRGKEDMTVSRDQSGPW